MKVKNIWGAIRLCILGLIGSFNVSSSMGAKTGVITAPTGSDANLVTLGATQPVRDTLMGVVRSALQLATALKIAIINFGVRKAIIVPAATVISSVTGGTGMIHHATFVKDDPTKATSPWTATLLEADADIEAALEAIVVTRKPSISVESLVNAVEDVGETSLFQVGGDAEGVELVVVIDQSAGTIKVFGAAGADATTAHTNAVALAEDVQFVQTPDSGGTQFAE